MTVRRLLVAKRSMNPAKVKHFFVEGLPKPKGSLVAVPSKTGKIVMMESRHGEARHAYSAWMDAVRYAARSKHYLPTDGEVEMTIDFRLPRPKSAKKRPRPYVKPDLDKLARAVLDALTGIVYVDDAQVCKLDLSKNYARVDYPVGAMVVVSETEKNNA